MLRRGAPDDDRRGGRLADRRATQRTLAQRLDLLDHHRAVSMVKRARRRLLQRIRRAERKRLDGSLGAFSGESRDDHDLGAVGLLDDLGQRPHPAHAGHLEVEQDDVDMQPGQLAQRILARDRGAKQLEPGILRDHARIDGADHARIVNHEDADFAADRGAGAGLPGTQRGYGIHRLEPHAMPMSSNLSCSVSWSNGFITYSSAPAAIASRIWPGSYSVVQKTTLGFRPSGLARSALMNSIPLITGMFQSSRITSGMLARQWSSAVRPFSASSALMPIVSTMWRETFRMTRESSTMRQVFILSFSSDGEGLFSYRLGAQAASSCRGPAMTISRSMTSRLPD